VEVAFSPRIAWWVEQSLGLEAVGVWKDWTVVRVPVVDEEGFLSWVVGFGEDAMVRSPDRVRKALVERLQTFTNKSTRVPSPPKAAARSSGKKAGATK
jgi:predicted DNA-binding transcriptional regulator YafY